MNICLVDGYYTMLRSIISRASNFNTIAITYLLKLWPLCGPWSYRMKSKCITYFCARSLSLSPPSICLFLFSFLSRSLRVLPRMHNKTLQTNEPRYMTRKVSTTHSVFSKHHDMTFYSHYESENKYINLVLWHRESHSISSLARFSFSLLWKTTSGWNDNECRAILLPSPSPFHLIKLEAKHHPSVCIIYASRQWDSTAKLENVKWIRW